MELKTIPLLDNYETTLSQEWNGQIWKMKVDDLPNIPVDSAWKFIWWFTTYVIVNPDKANFQLAEIDGYNSQEKTLNVINVNLQKWLWLNYTFSHHNQKSIVRISNNFAFWKKISEIVNSKQDYGIWDISWDYFLNIQNWVLKFKDKDNVEITLSDIAWKIWQDKKVSIDWTDTAKFLKDKIWTWLEVTWSWENKKISVNFSNIDFSAYPKTDLSWNSEIIVLEWWEKKKISLNELLDFVKYQTSVYDFVGTTFWNDLNYWSQTVKIQHNLGKKPRFIQCIYRPTSRKEILGFYTEKKQENYLGNISNSWLFSVTDDSNRNFYGEIIEVTDKDFTINYYKSQYFNFTWESTSYRFLFILFY